MTDTDTLRQNWLRSIGLLDGEPKPAPAATKPTRRKVSTRDSVPHTTPHAATSAAVCTHRSARIGQLNCGCKGQPIVYTCYLHTYCTPSPLNDFRDGPVKLDTGGQLSTNFAPWSTREGDRQEPIAGIPRLRACKLCPDFARPPVIEILNPTATVCVVTGYTPQNAAWREIGELTSATMRDYCRRQGYGFRCYTGDFEVDLAPSWSKVKWIRRALESHETVLWLDADALVTNPHVRIEDLHRGPEEMVLCADPIGINCGAILIRRSPFSERFLQDLWNSRNPKKDGLWEQDSTHKMIWQGRLARHLAIVEPRTFNSQYPHQDGSYFNWRPGDFVCHVYRTWGRIDRKLAGVREVLARAVEDTDDSWIDRTREAVGNIPAYPADHYSGRGIVTAAGGPVYQLQAYVLFRLLRMLGCQLPIQCWQDGERERNQRWTNVCDALGVECIDATARGFANLTDVSGLTYQRRIKYPPGAISAYGRKAFATLNSPWQEVLWLDADNYPVRDPSFLLDDPTYQQAGSLLWPDNVLANNAPNLRAFGLAPRIDVAPAGLESGQAVFDKARCWRALNLAVWYNQHAAYWFKHSWGDKDIILASWLATETPLNVTQPCRADAISIQQLGPDGAPLFMHRVGQHAKWKVGGDNKPSPWYPHHARCLEFIEDYRRLGLCSPSS